MMDSKSAETCRVLYQKKFEKVQLVGFYYKNILKEEHMWHYWSKCVMYRGADKSLARPGRKQATGTEDFDSW